MDFTCDFPSFHHVLVLTDPKEKRRRRRRNACPDQAHYYIFKAFFYIYIFFAVLEDELDVFVNGSLMKTTYFPFVRHLERQYNSCTQQVRS